MAHRIVAADLGKPAVPPMYSFVWYVVVVSRLRDAPSDVCEHGQGNSTSHRHSTFSPAADGRWMMWGDDEAIQSRALFGLAEALNVSRDGISLDELKTTLRQMLSRPEPPAHLPTAAAASATVTSPVGGGKVSASAAAGAGAGAGGATGWRWLLVVDHVDGPDGLCDWLDLGTSAGRAALRGDVLVTTRSTGQWARTVTEKPQCVSFLSVRERERERERECCDVVHDHPSSGNPNVCFV
jgi:hypothetical protein